jgi:hypothetical protein
MVKKRPNIELGLFQMSRKDYFPLAPMETIAQRKPMWLVDESWCMNRRAPGANQ